MRTAPSRHSSGPQSQCTGIAPDSFRATDSKVCIGARLTKFAGKGVNYGEASGHLRTSNNRKTGQGRRSGLAGLPVIEVDSVHAARWHRGKKAKWQIADQFPKVAIIFPVPGNDGIKSPQPLYDIVRRQQAQAVKPR